MRDRGAGDGARAAQLAARANLRGADPERYLIGQHTQFTEPPVLDSWINVDKRITRYCEKAATYFADRAAIGIERRVTEAEERWVVWCFYVRGGRVHYTVVNDRTRTPTK